MRDDDFMFEGSVPTSDNVELVGTDPVCDAENLRRIGDVFERYGCMK
jgi:hypothetical protein